MVGYVFLYLEPSTELFPEVELDLPALLHIDQMSPVLRDPQLLQQTVPLLENSWTMTHTEAWEGGRVRWRCCFVLRSRAIDIDV